MLQTSDRLVTYRSYGTTIPLLSLKISDLHTVPNRFYESWNVENRMSELCTFSQIRSHIIMYNTSVSRYIHSKIGTYKDPNIILMSLCEIKPNSEYFHLHSDILIYVCMHVTMCLDLECPKIR